MQQPNLNQNNWQDYLVTLGIIVVFFTGIIVFWQLVIKQQSPDPITQPEEPKLISKPVVICSPDNLSYNQITQNAKLIATRINLYAENKKFVNPQVVITKTETDTSKFACGYLFVKAGTKTNGALQGWENVYINPNGFGGHLNKDSAFSVSDGSDYSQYIYPLNKIQYWTGTVHNNALTADWASLLNVSNDIKFNISLNTNNKTGFIDEISIAYKCWNPATGEENTDCKLMTKTINE